MSLLFDTNESSIFKRLGYPGRWVKSQEVSATAAPITGSVVSTTGSQDDTNPEFGVAGIIVSTGAEGGVTLAGGGTLDIAELTAGVIYEFCVSEVSASVGRVDVLYSRGGD